MTKPNRLFLLLALLCAIAMPARAETEAWQQWISPAEFKALCTDLSKNVDLFQKVWAVAPNARFYGGTSRDFLWFVRGELSQAKSKAELERITARLKARPIRINEFVVGQSDVDVISSVDLSLVDFDKTYLTRLEVISPAWFEPGTPYYEQEKLQGHIPVEKLMLGKTGFASAKGLDYGDGVREIYSGRPTLHYDPRVTKTEMYKKQGNHPLLLALRYLRQVAVAYYRLYGKEHPDPQKLFALMDQDSREAVREILGDIRKNPKVLSEFLSNSKFRERVNKAMKKAFRSYTNPTAAKALFEHFGVDGLLEAFGDRILPYHGLMYTKHHDERDLTLQRRQLGLGDAYVTTVEAFAEEQGLKLQTADGETFLPMFHGTPTMENYRSIVFQGNIESEIGSAGRGVYATDVRSEEFAKSWKGPKTLTALLKIDPKAKVVDLTTGKGEAAFQRFCKMRSKLTWYFDGKPEKDKPRDDYEAFADFVGADLLHYPHRAKAYVIGNGAAILGQEGITIPIHSLEQMRQDLEKHHFDRERFLRYVKLDRSLLVHARYLLNGLPEAEIVKLTLDALSPDEPDLSVASLDGLIRSGFPPKVLFEGLMAQIRAGRPCFDNFTIELLHRHPELYPESVDLVGFLADRPESQAHLAQRVLGDEFWAHHPKGAELVRKLIAGGHCDKQIITQVLYKLAWQERPEFPSLVQELLTRGMSRSGEHTTAELEAGFREAFVKVTELNDIRKIAKGEGLQVWLKGQAANRLARHLLLEMDKETARGTDFDIVSIYRDGMPLELLVSGDKEAAERLETAIHAKYPFGGKGGVMMFQFERVESKDGRPKVADQSRFGGTLAEITAKGGAPVISHVKLGEVPFTEALRIGYVPWPGLPHGTDPHAALVPILDYLFTCFHYGLKVTEADRRAIAAEVRHADVNHPGVKTWLLANFMDNSFASLPDYEYAFRVLGETKVKDALLARHDVEEWELIRVRERFLEREPLKSFALGAGTGKTARELGISIVGYETNSFPTYMQLAHSPDGRVNVLLNNGPAGEGFYTQIGSAAGPGTGFTVRFHVAPEARLGNDFDLIDGKYLVVKNRNVLTLVQDHVPNPRAIPPPARSKMGAFVAWTRKDRDTVVDLIRPLMTAVAKHGGNHRDRCENLMRELTK